MSYPPPHHQELNFENIVRTIEAFPLATVISVEGSKILTSHIPLIYEATEDGSRKLIGHLDRSNPQVELLQQNQNCAVVFNGPQTYISPSVYSTKQLPTWNYIKCHIEGKAKRIENAEVVKASMVKMTAFLEPNQNFKLEKDDERMERLIDYIVGFEIDITAWEGKFKLSQDKSTKDQDLAKQELLASEPKKRASFIEAVYRNHKTS